MSIDTELEKAVIEATHDLGQSPLTANKIIAWLNEMSNGNITPEDTNTFLSTTLDSIQTDTYEAEDEN
ncbi:hypothetical protein [Desulfovibrio ferrophilus]|uniref:Doublesex-and mab-3-related transcription factor A2 n=1 Tax=Desulfovibrio ferrophilus TaxID=241368 RepID=A0A2Z6AYV1_9BACT|nr:hypothetical protein [Desulfovibrio ferrophilus]BBD08432.1 doublesex-and mab-3-related transcription factor A2 [Desulfovibrio ferrophilus]